MSTEKDLLLTLLDHAFEARAWHGATLYGALRGVSAAEAAWRPAPGRHSIWELALHCAYWKHVVRRRLVSALPDPFPRPGRDFPRLPEVLDDAAWKDDRQLLRHQHRLLREVVAALPAASLHQAPPGQKRHRILHIHGIATHDAYHAGQVQLLKRLREETSTA